MLNMLASAARDRFSISSKADRVPMIKPTPPAVPSTTGALK
jgi:hypothetical protein